MQFKLLLKKALKRIRKQTNYLVPLNTHYRPVSVEPVIPGESDSCTTSGNITIYSIYKRYITTLDISEELYDACSFYWKPQRYVETDYVVVEVPNGRLHTDNECSVAIITSENTLVDNVSLSLQNGKVTKPEENNIFRQLLFTEPAKVEGTVFSLLSGGAGINNIGHWFLDVLPRLHLLQQSGLFEKVDWFLVPSTRYSYQTETLELLGIPKEKIISGVDYPHIVADSIIASTAPRGNHTLVPKWLIEYMRAAFLPAAQEVEEQSVQAEGPLLFISRRDSSIRNILNEDELQQVLSQYGFNTILSSKLSIAEKVALFSKAKVILSPTGAGLISMLFCQPGTKLVEIFNEGFVIEPFFDIATKLDLDYQYIICKSQGRKVTSAKQGQQEHLLVETDKVEEVLAQLMKKGSEDLVEK